MGALTLRRAALAAAVLAAAACGAASRVVRVPSLAPCRTVVPVGRPAAPLPEVRWMAPASAEDRATLHAWCETVGGVAVDTTPDAPGPGGADSLAVITWNTHIGGGDVVELVDRLRSGALPGGAPRHFVLLLQEVYRAGLPVPAGKPGIPVPEGHREAPPGKRRMSVVEAADSLGLSLLYVPSMRNGHTGDPATEEDRGNAVLSTLPLSELAVVELPVQLQRRAAAVASVRGTTAAGAPWCMRVASAHLDVLVNGYQARVLGDALSGERTLVMGGDFNSPLSRLGTVAHLRRRFPHSPPVEYGRTHRMGRLDYLFARSASGARGRAVRVPETFGSDHRPVVGWFPTAGAECGAATDTPP